MLEKLHLKNVGPAPEFELELAPRVNLITGDNGLGKSFLLDVAWWVLTGLWAGAANPRAGRPDMVRPSASSVPPSIFGTIKDSMGGDHFNIEAGFEFRNQTWGRSSSGATGSLVLQIHVDGGVSVFDPLRGSGVERFFVFSPKDTWDGLTREQPVWGVAEAKRTTVCNGLIRDWVVWQLEKNQAFKQLIAALRSLSPHEAEKLEPGQRTRASLDDSRDIPTLKMPYGQEVPVTYAPAGIRRVISLAYMLVWTWQEHQRAAELTREKPVREIVLLIDELEQHLHPSWQQKILGSILETVKQLLKSDVNVQIVATTHSPLVMSSLEPLFDDKLDAWFDLNLVDGVVKLEKMPWAKRGGAENWLTSEAFDLPSTRAPEQEAAINEASGVLDDPKPTKRRFLQADKKLRETLAETDEFWVRWRFIGEKRGWL